MDRRADAGGDQRCLQLRRRVWRPAAGLRRRDDLRSRAHRAPLQYNYNDLLGAQNLFYSATRVLAHGVDRMLPSLGEPIDDPAAAVGALRQNILEWRRITPGFPELRDIEVADEVEQVLPHLYRGRHSGAETHFLVADSGKVMCIDYGYAQTVQTVPGKSHPSNRRPLLHSMRGLQKHTGATSIDAVLVSHFHDDHVNGINLLRRLYGTQVWAADLFADLLEEPMRWDRPCLSTSGCRCTRPSNGRESRSHCRRCPGTPASRR
jgi:hypothetical protein